MREKPELTRAEIARRRRAQRAANELTQTGKRAVKPMVQPVTRRVTPAHKPTFIATQKKRQFRIALGTPGLHLQKPRSALQGQPDRRWRRASLWIVILLVLTILSALTLPYFNIPSVTVLGNNRISREEISNAAGVLGQSIFTVQPKDVEMRLRMNYPELLRVDVSVYLPNHVYVTIEERDPVILWQQNDAYTWIDMNGVAFRPRGVLEGLVPVVGLANPQTGVSDNPLIPPAYMQKDLAEAILLLAPSVPAGTVMFYDGSYGLGWDDARGWRVFFGTSPRDMALKVRVYESLAQSLTERGISPAFINVAYPDAPYYRMTAEVQNKPVTDNSGH